MNDTGHYPLARLRAENPGLQKYLMPHVDDQAVFAMIREFSVRDLYDLSSYCDEEPAVDDITECVSCWAYLEAQRREENDHETVVPS